MRKMTLLRTVTMLSLFQLMIAVGCGRKASESAARVEQLESRLHLTAQAYDWKSVTIKGNGFIDGIVYSPAAPNTVFMHTDMGGAYRWDQDAGKWQPMTDWLQVGDAAQNNGAESMAVDPTDANKVYLVAGTYQSTSAILRSSDGGRTWQRTNVSGIQVDGNGWGRAIGERMAVDPNRPSIVYYGARFYDNSHRGLWKSTDSAATWSQVGSFTSYGDVKDKDGDGNTYESAESVGLPFVIFDKASGSAGTATPGAYVAVATAVSSNTKLYRTSDAGTSWSAVPNQPTTAQFPMRAVLSDDGSVLYVTYASQAGPLASGDTGGIVYKVSNPSSASPTWTNITPAGASGMFTAIAIDPTNPNTIYTSAQNNWPCNIWRSTNGGSSWTALNPNSHRNDSSAPFATSQTVHWLTDIQVDPFNNNVAMFNTGYGLYRTTNLTAATPTWTFFNEGFEQSAALELASPHTGSVRLISAIGDRGGFRHIDFNVSPVIGPHGQNNGKNVGTDIDIDVAWDNVNYVVRSVYTAPYVQYSLDNGITWAWASSTNAGGTAGNIAISADGTKMVFEPNDSGQVRYATRSGSTWSAWSNPASGTPANGAKLVADLVTGSTNFYAISGTTVSRSTDGGVNWTVMTTSAPSGMEWLRAVPDNAGHLLIATRGGGLWRSINGGANWTRVSSSAVTVANQVGVGAAKPGNSYPAVYVGGTVNGVNGFFRCDDITVATPVWTIISDLSHNYGWVTVIQGDSQLYGRLYVGANGRGILYGDIHQTPTLPAGWTSADIGSPGSAGAAGESSGTWEVTGGGAGITGTSDQFRFAYQSLNGDGTIVAQVTGVPLAAPTNNNARAGVMIRESLTSGSANAFVALTPGSVNGVVFSSRTTAGASTASTNFTNGVYPPYWVKLVRSGNQFTAYYSKDGSAWTQLGSTISINMAQNVYIGLAATASDSNHLNQATFRNVTISSDTTPPTVNAAGFNWRNAPNQITVSFSEDVLSSLQTSDLQVTNSTGGNVPVLSFTYGAGNTATFSLAQPLNDGDYTATLLAAEVRDNAGNALASDFPLAFFTLGADFTRDRKVNTQDFNVFAANFGASGDFALGDASYDGQVDSVDFSILLTQYGKSLGTAPSQPLPALFGVRFDDSDPEDNSGLIHELRPF
jgi:photosystem II stability/assembly factor-like uncharacterized protein